LLVHLHWLALLLYVTCLVINLESIRCMWNLQGTPQVNYTFYSRFNLPCFNLKTICAEYLSENGRNIGCTLPYIRLQRFESFYTELRGGNKTYKKEHDLKTKVKLNPPTNLTVKNGSDLNLWFYWNHTVNPSCVESQVRIRKNDNNWETLKVSRGGKHYCHSLPSSTARYELQVKSRVDNYCGESEFWSDWSEPVVWGFNNTTGKAMPVWTALLYVVIISRFMISFFFFLLLTFFFILDDWFHFSKGLVKERFNTNFNERACTVREYQPVSRSDSNGSDSSRLTTATDQTDCSIPIAENEPEDTSAPFYTTVIASEDEQQVSV
uniref:Fibronectin type-III domain-containing protein n=1 Tax=Poecilia mexicana TaxID=48701 RepID=A0A3B3YT07_9TELE